MSRARKFGALTAVLACAGLVAGCGGGGYTAAESAPGSNEATTTTPPTQPSPGPETALGAYAPTEVVEAVETFKGYQQFPKERAGKIFVDPTVKPAPAPVAAPQASALAAAVTSVPVAAAPATTAPAATTVTPTPVATKTYMATLDVSGAAQAVKVGDAVPAAAPQFTVQAVTDAKVTLKLNSGTLPGGGTTIEIAVGESVTLSNPTTGASYVVKVTAIKPQA